MEEYWLVRPDGTKRHVDVRCYNMQRLMEVAHEAGCEVLVAAPPPAPPARGVRRAGGPWAAAAVADGPSPQQVRAVFGRRLWQIHECRVPFRLDLSPRPTRHTQGMYYAFRRLVRVYLNDADQGRRPLEELFDTFLHEVAHHLEHTEPESFGATRCHRVFGVMHSCLFWTIYRELTDRWWRVADDHP